MAVTGGADYIYYTCIYGPQVTVTGISIFRAELPFHAPFRISLAETDSTTNLFVRLTASGGQVGWGEASPSPAITGDTAATMAAAGPALAKVILGRSVSDVGGAVRAMRGRVAGQPTMRSAFDMALFDLAAQQAGLPLYAYLGGAKRSFATDNTVGMDTPEVMAETAGRFVAEGFTAIKAKVGGPVSLDVARIRAIRQVIGPSVPLRIDANQGWDVAAAVAVLTHTKDAGIEYCEQPVRRGDIRGLKRVRDTVAVPIMADESVFDHHDALALATAEACDYLNIKLSKSSGMWVGRKIAAVAEAAGMACMVGCMSETRLGLTAAAHFISAHSIIRFADLDSHVDHTVDPVEGGIWIEGGRVLIPDGPGIGATFSEEFLAECDEEEFLA
ncbi:MAG: L-alanine-DL-glutamate epimerase-like enolase superfamily enzyme [Rhodothermales bacterium]